MVSIPKIVDTMSCGSSMLHPFVVSLFNPTGPTSRIGLRGTEQCGISQCRRLSDDLPRVGDIWSTIGSLPNQQSVW